MAKKRQAPDPIVADEPARPEEQFRLDQGQAAPPSTRPPGGGGSNPYGARTARERRAASGRPAPRSDATVRRDRRREERNAKVVSELLEHPTKQVSEDELRHEYNYVIADLRNTAILAGGLIVAMVILAQILPK